jgi:enamine deaminase RidA (YjgF/YER057c/UK114 family)
MATTRLSFVEPIGDLPRIAGAVIHGDVVYLSGVTGGPTGDIRAQTRTALERIDRLLRAAGSDRAHILSAQVWLKDMAHFAAHNAVWNAWIDQTSPPARACVQAALYRPELLVEIMVVAARPIA